MDEVDTKGYFTSARNDVPECVAPVPEQIGFTGI